MSWREKTMSGNVPPQVVFSQDNVAGAQPLWGIGARLADHARGPRRSPLAVQRGNRSGPPGPTKAVIVGQLLRNRGQQAGEHRAGLGCGPFGNHLRDPILVLGGPVDQGPQPGPVRRTLDPGIAEIGQAGADAIGWKLSSGSWWWLSCWAASATTTDSRSFWSRVAPASSCVWVWPDRERAKTLMPSFAATSPGCMTRHGMRSPKGEQALRAATVCGRWQAPRGDADQRDCH